MLDQAAKGATFRELHRRTGAFIIPNPFDTGSARILAGLGFEALATTSAGFAFSRGEPDFRPQREVVLEHLKAIVDATDLPVSADLQNGFSDTPEGVSRTLSMAVTTGIVGASIEDATGDDEAPLYPIALATERIRAASEVAQAQPFPFILTARAENLLVGQNDIGDVIGRLQAYQEAGADVLYAPGLTRPEDVATVLSSIDRPLNVVLGLGGVTLTRSQLATLGVKRISVGSALARAAYAAVERAGKEMLEGTFSFADAAIPYQRINSLFNADGTPPE